MPMIWLYARKNSKLQTPDADDLAQRAQNIKIADLPMPHISFTSTKTPILYSNVISWFRLTPTGVYP